MAGRDLSGPDVTGMRSRLARVPEWQRARLMSAMSQLLGQLLGDGDRVIELIEVVRRQVGEHSFEYRAQTMNAEGVVVAPSTWSRTRVEAVELCAQQHAAGGGVVVAVICRQCFEELPDPAEFPGGSRYACRCGMVHERSRYMGGWKPIDG